MSYYGSMEDMANHEAPGPSILMVHKSIKTLLDSKIEYEIKVDTEPASIFQCQTIPVLAVNEMISPIQPFRIFLRSLASSSPVP